MTASSDWPAHLAPYMHDTTSAAAEPEDADADDDVQLGTDVRSDVKLGRY